MSATANRNPGSGFELDVERFRYTDGSLGVSLRTTHRGLAAPGDHYELGRAVARVAELGTHLPHPSNLTHAEAFATGIEDGLAERGWTPSMFGVVVEQDWTAADCVDAWWRAFSAGRADDAAYFLDRAALLTHVQLHGHAPDRSWS